MSEQSAAFTLRFAEALQAATLLHAGQHRKGTNIPYISHLLGVAAFAMYYGADEEEAIGALLHDAIEDAPEPLEADGVRRYIHFRFGERVLQIVEGCTDSDVNPKPPWLERKKAYLAKVENEPPSVLLVSACDKLHNASSILTDHRRIGDQVWARFKASKEGVIGYYRGLVQAFQRTGHHDELVRELDRVVTEIENATGCKGVWPPLEK